MTLDKKNKKILIIEDDAIFLYLLKKKIAQEGFTVLVEKDGETGLSEAVKYHPDLILLDILLPKMNGMTMLDELRKNVWGKTAKVIVLTNLSDWSSTSKAVNRDVHEYLVKSDWKIEDVVKRVKKKLNMS